MFLEDRYEYDGGKYMLRTWTTLIALLLVLVPLGTANAQNTGKLTGTVMDAQSGDPLPGANVVVQGTQRGAATGANGKYTILGISAGSYDVKASFVGYQSVTIEDVEINAGYTRQLDFELNAGQQLEEVQVTYEQPLIQNDAIGTPKVTTAKQINNLPVRNVGNIAALQGGVVSNPGSNDLFVRGGREQQVSYYVDGVKVLGNEANVPTQAIQQQETIVGTIPPRYGDAQSGIISITTKSGAQEFNGSLEAITSEVLDGYGYNLASASIGGPIVPDKLSFFVSAEGRYESDRNPFAIETPRMPDNLYNTLQQTPQGLQVQDADGTIGYVPLPRGVRPGMEGDIINQLDVAGSPFLPDNFDASNGVSLTEGQGGTPISLANVIDPARYNSGQSKDEPVQDIDVTGNLTITPFQSVNVRLGGNFDYQERETYSYARSLFARNNYFQDTDQGWRIYGSWRQYLSDVTFYHVQVDYTDDRGWFYNGDFSRDIEDTFFYGDISHPANSTIQTYRNLTTTQVQTGEDGDGNPITETRYSYRTPRNVDGGSAGVVNPGTFDLPGAQPDDYSKYHNQQLRFTADATTQLGVNQIQFGGSYEQRTRRYIRLFTTLNLARYYNDVDGAEAGKGKGVDNYKNLPYEAFQPITFERYGYDFRGLNEVDDQNIGRFSDVVASGQTGEVSDDVYNTAPQKPIYYAGYISDKIEFNDLVINLGLRADVFDNNTPVLKDPLSLVPVTRGGDLTEKQLAMSQNTDNSDPTDDNNFVPGDDYAVYFSGQDIVGYHDLDQNFYNNRGEEVAFDDIGGRPQQVEGTNAFSPGVFKDYEPQLTLMPRIGVSFPITNRALFFASYNVTSQRPSEESFLSYLGYRGVTTQNRIANPDLKPETTTSYELGFRQRIGQRAALELSGFYRTQDNLIQVRNVPEAFPNGYQSFRNVDFATIKGAEIDFDLRRAHHLSLNANYTLQFAQGTGSDASSLGVIAWRSSLGGYTPNFIFPTSFDRRHSINITADYRLGEDEGPMILGRHALENFGINVIGKVASGMPYTRVQSNRTYAITEDYTNNVQGGANGARLPWTTNIDLRVDRQFGIGNGTDLTAFVWVQNLLDTDSVLGVYRRTGQPDYDGWIDTQAGNSSVNDAATNLADPVAGQAYRFLYNEYVDAPIGLGVNHYSGGRRYSLPRRIRLGVRLDF